MPLCENYFWLQQLFVYGVICHCYNTGPVNNQESFSNIHISLHCEPYMAHLERHNSEERHPTHIFHATNQVSSYFSALEHKASTKQCQHILFPAITLASFKVFPSVAVSSSIILLQLFLSLPPPHCAWGTKKLAFLWQRNPSSVYTHSICISAV